MVKIILDIVFSYATFGVFLFGGFIFLITMARCIMFQLTVEAMKIKLEKTLTRECTRIYSNALKLYPHLMDKHMSVIARDMGMPLE